MNGWWIRGDSSEKFRFPLSLSFEKMKDVRERHMAKLMRMLKMMKNNQNLRKDGVEQAYESLRNFRKFIDLLSKMIFYRWKKFYLYASWYSQNGNLKLCLKIIPNWNLYLCTSAPHHHTDICHGQSSSISFCKQPLNIHFLALSYFCVFVIVRFYFAEMNFHNAALILGRMRFTFFTFTSKTIAWNEDKFEDRSLMYVQRHCFNWYKFELLYLVESQSHFQYNFAIT